MGIVIPVANEERGVNNFLSTLLEEFSCLGGNYAFTAYIIMDSFSKDKTFEIVKSIGEQDPRIKPIFFKESSGPVSCYLKGFKCALKDSCDYIIEMDSGFSHPPSKIKDILYTLDTEGYDVVFMSRFMKTSAVKNFPFYRKIASRGGSLLANFWLGTRFSDATSGFQAFKVKVLKSFNLNAFISARSFYSTEMKYYCRNYRYKELPFTYTGSRTVFSSKLALIALKMLFKIKENEKYVCRDSKKF